MSSLLSPRIALARLLRSQGRRGELLAEPLTDLPGLFIAGRSFWLAPEPGSRSDAPLLTLEASWAPAGRNAGRIVLKFANVDSISAAEAIRGQSLWLEVTDLPERDPDTYLTGELLGCAVYAGERHVGEIVDVQFATTPDGRSRLPEAAPLLLIQLAASPEDEPALVPFVKAWLTEVDIPGRRIVMSLPEGLLGDKSVEPSS